MDGVTSGISLVILAYAVVIFSPKGVFGANDTPDLLYFHEPPGLVDFSNMTGTRLDCSATGTPTPSVAWTTADGSPVTDIPRLRQMLLNGSLVFPPFRAEDYRQDVHAAVYRCTASSIVGSIISRDVRVRAVVKQPYEVQVYDEFVIVDNTAVLKCHVPTFISDYVTVTSWIKDTSYNVQEPVKTGAKYTVFPTGELHIRDVSKNDGIHGYRCRTTHRLTGESRLSSTSGKLIVTDSRGSVPPRITDSKPVLSARQGETVIVPCAAQGYPVPSYSWILKQDDGKVFPLLSSGRIQIQGGNLVIDNAKPSDSGTYVCAVNNSVGSERTETVLTVTAPLSVYVRPQRQTVDLGKPAVFTCVISGFPVKAVTWVKDGKPLAADRMQGTLRDTLRLEAIQKEDRGMYQCFASNEQETMQAAAELQLGDAAPQMEYTFRESTYQPGPKVSLRCSASGNPLPKFTWLVDGLRLPTSDRYRTSEYADMNGNVISYLNISSVRTEDGGEYHCVAENRVGKVEHSARLNVYGLPSIRRLPLISAVAGNDVTIKCPVIGYPIDSIAWEKDGKKIPVNRRQVVFPNGTLQIRTVQRSPDAGKYTCIVRNNQGQSARGDFEVVVLVPPKINPFSFQDSRLHEGAHARLVCGVTQGDLPIAFRWLKDGREITPGHGVTVRDFDEFSNILTISSATPWHNGNYTCIAKNAAASSNYTTHLTVNVPPRWIVEPKDLAVSAGKRVQLDCQADGFPRPLITWMKAVANVPGEYREVFLTNQMATQLDNGTLIMDSVRDVDEGEYLCQATNGIGTGLSTVVLVDVQVPARFETKLRQLTARKGQTAKLLCEAKGDTPLSLSWGINGLRLDPDADSRYQMKEYASQSGMVSELLVIQVERRDTAQYTCTAKNSFGSDETRIKLTVQEIPEFPMGLKILEQTSKSVQIGWLKPYDGNSPVYRYTVQYKKASAGWQDKSSNITVPGSESSVSVSSLHPATTYHIRVFAENEVGTSEPSEPIAVTTGEEAPIGSPENIRAEALDSQSIKVSWMPPRKELWNGYIRGYHVGYKVYDTSEPYTFKSVENQGDTMHSLNLQLSNLRKYTKYGIVIQAYNHIGSGPKSDELVIVTAEDVPSQSPSDVRCVALSSQSLHVDWEAPAANAVHGILQGYKIIYRPAEEWYDEASSESKVTTAYKTTLHGLNKNTNYSIQVLAFTRAGDGAKSDPTFCKTNEDVPESPADIKVVMTAVDSVLVVWKPPAKSNGLVAKYTVYMRAADSSKEDTTKHILPSTVTSYEAVGLKKNRRYDFWVTASTVVGEGQSTKVASITVTGPMVPAKAISFNDQIITPWKRDVELPCRAAGIPDPIREWKFNGVTIMGNERIRLLSNGSLVISNIQIPDGGSYSCTIQNTYGTDEIIHNLIVQVPPSPPQLLVLATTHSTIELTWKLNQPDRDSIKGYIINYKRDYGEWEEIHLDADYSRFVLEHLDCGTRYQLYITALNKIGIGEPSEPILTRSKGSAPEAPEKHKLIRENTSFVALRFEAWSDGGCPILHFVVEYKPVDQDTWRLVANNIHPQQEQFIIPDLVPASRYNLRVTAHNSAGSTVAEYNFSTLTVDGGTISPDTVMSADGGRRPFFMDVSILAPVGSAIILLLVVAVFICFCIQRRRRLHRKTPDPPPPPPPVMDPKIPPPPHIQKNLSVGSFTCLLRNTENQGNTNSPADYNKKEDQIDDISPYATSNIPGCHTELKMFPQRLLAVQDKPLRTCEGLYSKVKKPLQQRPRPDSIPSENQVYPSAVIAEEVTLCPDMTHLSDTLYALRPSAPHYGDSHVPDLLDHGPESSSSSEPSPESRRRTYPHYGTTGNRVPARYSGYQPSGQVLRHMGNAEETSFILTDNCGGHIPTEKAGSRLSAGSWDEPEVLHGFPRRRPDLDLPSMSLQRNQKNHFQGPMKGYSEDYTIPV